MNILSIAALVFSVVALLLVLRGLVIQNRRQTRFEKAQESKRKKFQAHILKLEAEEKARSAQVVSPWDRDPTFPSARSSVNVLPGTKYHW